MPRPRAFPPCLINPLLPHLVEAGSGRAPPWLSLGRTKQNRALGLPWIEPPYCYATWPPSSTDIQSSWHSGLSVRAESQSRCVSPSWTVQFSTPLPCRPGSAPNSVARPAASPLAPFWAPRHFSRRVTSIFPGSANWAREIPCLGGKDLVPVPNWNTLDEVLLPIATPAASVFLSSGE